VGISFPKSRFSSVVVLPSCWRGSFASQITAVTAVVVEGFKGLAWLFVETTCLPAEFEESRDD
jgi:hypothetical protein